MSNGTMISDKDNIKNLRVLTMLSGLRLEVKTGMRLTSKAPTCYTLVKREYNLKGNKKKVLEQFESILLEKGLIKSEHK